MSETFSSVIVRVICIEYCNFTLCREQVHISKNERLKHTFDLYVCHGGSFGPLLKKNNFLAP